MTLILYFTKSNFIWLNTFHKVILSDYTVYALDKVILSDYLLYIK